MVGGGDGGLCPLIPVIWGAGDQLDCSGDRIAASLWFKSSDVAAVAKSVLWRKQDKSVKTVLRFRRNRTLGQVTMHSWQENHMNYWLEETFVSVTGGII